MGKEMALRHKFENLKLGTCSFKNYSRKIKCAFNSHINYCYIDFFYKTKLWIRPPQHSVHTYQNFSFKQVDCENSTLYNHCSDNNESNWKDNSEFALLYSLLQGSTDFFLAFQRNTLSYQKFKFENNLKMLCYVPCCKVQQVFFWLSKEISSAIKIFNWK